MSGCGAGGQLTREHPWPGLQSFTEEGREFFCGRQEETEAMLRLVRRERLTVFFGQSGLGKSSLLRAGLFPRLRPLNLLPVPVRLDYAAEARPLEEQVKQALLEAFRENRVEARAPEPGESLWEYFHREDLDFWDGRNRLVIPVLVFDQFEERFTLGRRDEAADGRADDFLTALSQLVENRPPEALRARFEKDAEAALAYDFDKQTCKVVLSLREDFLPELDGLRGRFPSIDGNRFRLLPMNEGQAREVVLQPGGELVNAEVASAIVAFVAFSRQHRGGGEVEPALLSVVLQELNQRRRQLGHKRISADLLSGSKDKILEEFYEQAVKDLPPAARLFIEDGLLTSSGYRDSIALEDARAEFGLDEASLGALVNRHLIRREERLGAPRLELVHDLLTGVIAASRNTRRERERQSQELAKARSRQRELEREKIGQQRNARRLAAACVCLGVIVIGLAAWLYKTYRDGRPCVSYARDFAKCWGVPQGIGLLTEAQTHHRAWSLKFIRQGVNGPLVEMQAIDARGNPTDNNSVGTYLHEAGEGAKMCRWEFVYDSGKRVVYEKAYDQHSNFVWGMTYMPAKAGQRWRVAQYIGSDGLPKAEGASLAEFVRFSYSTNGFEDRVLFQDRYGHPRRGLYGAYGLDSVYDRWGRRTKMTSLGADEEPMIDTGGNATAILIYDADGNITNRCALDENGNPCDWREGYCRAVATFDRYGNETEETYYGTHDEPIRSRKGYHGFDLRYDEQGDWTNVVYLGVDGQPSLLWSGYAVATARWDGRGNRTEQACFDVGLKPAVDKNSGSHRTVTAYDALGHLTNKAYLGIDGGLTRSREGYAVETAKWDEKGNQIEWACFDTNKQATLNADGYHQAVIAYDEHGKGTNWSYLGVNGQPVLTRFGYAATTARWDERGNQIEWACFGLGGKPAVAATGTHKWIKAYDDEGHLIEEFDLDADNQPVANTEFGNAPGYERRYYYDHRGHAIEEAYFSPDGTPATNQVGIHRGTAVYDEWGNMVELCSWQGGLAATREGWAIQRWVKDKHGRILSDAYFGVDGRPCLNFDGYGSLTNRWDAQGHPIETAWYGIHGEPIVNSSGWHGVRQAYDAQGDCTNRLFLGTNDLPKSGKDGYASESARWSGGRRVEWRYFGESGEPVAAKAGYHRRTVEYDSQGNVVSEKRWDAQGVPVLRPEDSRSVIVIERVLPGTQAAMLGLQPGDIFWEYGDWALPDYLDEAEIGAAETDLQDAIFAPGAGQRRLVILRAGELKTFEVKPGQLGVRFDSMEESLPHRLLGKPARTPAGQ